MRDRSLVVTALAFSSILIALYCQSAAIGLLLTGAVFSLSGSVHAAATFALGGLFLGLAMSAYFLGYGLWTRKHWAWIGGLGLLTAFALANVLLSVVATSFISSIGPVAGAVVGIWALARTRVRAELLGPEKPRQTSVVVADAMEAAGTAR